MLLRLQGNQHRVDQVYSFYDFSFWKYKIFLLDSQSFFTHFNRKLLVASLHSIRIALTPTFCYAFYIIFATSFFSSSHFIFYTFSHSFQLSTSASNHCSSQNMLRLSIHQIDIFMLYF